MTRALSIDLRERVIAAVEGGASPLVARSAATPIVVLSGVHSTVRNPCVAHFD